MKSQLQLVVQNVASGADVVQPGFLIAHLKVIVVLVVEKDDATPWCGAGAGCT